MLAAAGAIAGTATVALPFSYDVSPAAALMSPELWSLAAPFFLAWPVAAASIRVTRNGVLHRSQRKLAFLTGAAAFVAASISVFKLLSDRRPETAIDVITVATPPLALALAMLAGRHIARAAFGPVLVLQLAYIGNAWFCLLLFLDDWQFGAFCAVATTAIYVAHIVTVNRVVAAEITVPAES